MAEPFFIHLIYKEKELKLAIQECYKSNQIERYEVIFKERKIVLENNRPALRLQGKNSHKFNWKLREGKTDIDKQFLDNLTDELERYIYNVIEKGIEHINDYMKTKKGY